MHEGKVDHPFEPVYDSASRILILGSFPSVKSREKGFYYGHPRNRFWEVIARLYDLPLPSTIDCKRSLLRQCNIALWDVISSCEITGSSDQSIRNVIVNDVAGLLKKSQIDRIYANGQVAARLYDRYLKEDTGIEIIVLPSTSPANAAYKLEKLIAAWNIVLAKTPSK